MKAILKKILPPPVLDFYRSLQGAKNSLIFHLNKHRLASYQCNICDYHGPFMAFDGRLHASCPKCRSLERHRLLFWIMQGLSQILDFSQMSMLHFAPEDCLVDYFKKNFKEHHTADLFMRGVDFKVDMTNLPFRNGRYDFVLACHVLGHIKDDHRVLSERRRVLRPGGLAILPVPINLALQETVEYGRPDPNRVDHVRDCGVDYYERYREYFGKVELFYSNDTPPALQTWICGAEEKRPENVPVCYV